MKAAATPNATHIPRRCAAMCPACPPTIGSGWWRANSTSDEASDSSTSSQVQAERRVIAAMAIGTR